MEKCKTMFIVQEKKNLFKYFAHESLSSYEDIQLKIEDKSNIWLLIQTKIKV